MSTTLGQPKPAATLSSALVARKGQARPAMRPQGLSGLNAISDSLDDLGWNDMGHNAMQPDPVPAASPVGSPPVLRQREVLMEEIEAPTLGPDEPALRAQAPGVGSDPCRAPPVASKKGLLSMPRHGVSNSRHVKSGKAAFTLRLDGDRHLRLRLASAMSHQSLQQVVTQALDNFFKSLPEVEEMAERLSAGAQNFPDNEG